MSSNTAISAIETVKKKLEKYNNVQQIDKIEEYLCKLQNTTITSALIRETKIDELVLKLASNNEASYHSIAQNLLKKWQDRNLLSTKINDFKDQTIKNTKKVAVDKKLPVKRKSNADDRAHLHHISESQSSDECKSGDRDQSSSTKKLKVLSFAEYISSKKSIPTSSTINNSTDKALSPTQIEQIYAQFNATGKQLASSAPDIAKTVDNKLKQADRLNDSRSNYTANGHNLGNVIHEKIKLSSNDIWAEEDDDDEDEIIHPNPIQQKQEKPTQPLPTKTKQTVKYSDLDSQQLKILLSTSKLEKPAKTKLPIITPSLISVDYTGLSPNVSKLYKADILRKPDESCNFLRSKHGRQAIYSGMRPLRKNMVSLQDLCIETLKEHIDDICHKHFFRLPYYVVKSIIDTATPEQLHAIVDNNPDYIDDVEPLWQRHCELHFKDAKREEYETYYDLYLRKHNENEDRLQRITALAKKKKAQTIDTARHTQPLNIRQQINRHNTTSTRVTRQAINLPSSNAHRAHAKPKKPTITPLLKKTLKAFHGKG